MGCRIGRVLPRRGSARRGFRRRPSERAEPVGRTASDSIRRSGSRSLTFRSRPRGRTSESQPPADRGCRKERGRPEVAAASTMAPPPRGLRPATRARPVGPTRWCRRRNRIPAGWGRVRPTRLGPAPRFRPAPFGSARAMFPPLAATLATAESTVPSIAATARSRESGRPASRPTSAVRSGRGARWPTGPNTSLNHLASGHARTGRPTWRSSDRRPVRCATVSMTPRRTSIRRPGSVRVGRSAASAAGRHRRRSSVRPPAGKRPHRPAPCCTPAAPGSPSFRKGCRRSRTRPSRPSGLPRLGMVEPIRRARSSDPPRSGTTARPAGWRRSRDNHDIARRG